MYFVGYLSLYCVLDRLLVAYLLLRPFYFLCILWTFSLYRVLDRLLVAYAYKNYHDISLRIFSYSLSVAYFI